MFIKIIFIKITKIVTNVLKTNFVKYFYINYGTYDFSSAFVFQQFKLYYFFTRQKYLRFNIKKIIRQNIIILDVVVLK